MSAGECWAKTCDSTETRRYLIGPACALHTPAALASRPEPEHQVDYSRSAAAIRRAPTPAWTKGGTDLNKERPGGYMSRQRAARQHEARQAAAITAPTVRRPDPIDTDQPTFVGAERARQARLEFEETAQ